MSDTSLFVSPEGLVRCPDCQRHVVAAADLAETRCPFCSPRARAGALARMARGGLLAAAILGSSSPVVACYGAPGAFDLDAMEDASAGAFVSRDPDQVPDDVVALSGAVVDAVTGLPIADALVALEDGSAAVRTREDGRWVIAADHFPVLAPGAAVRIRASQPGYSSAVLAVNVPGDHLRGLVLALEPGGADAGASD